ncbi:hypothetical protein Y1Q_0011236 [Alligator mississippiensis]|uniref:Uncharacterized protein n=1 Tax=Alligator mississippiensis TaxID=8496 RepID=A0A151N7Y1_ALLMI|nr:hypothetical protein Y1Q_0011236 [Alligator mississippiensis]
MILRGQIKWKRYLQGWGRAACVPSALVVELVVQLSSVFKGQLAKFFHLNLGRNSFILKFNWHIYLMYDPNLNLFN